MKHTSGQTMCVRTVTVYVHGYAESAQYTHTLICCFQIGLGIRAMYVCHYSLLKKQTKWCALHQQVRILALVRALGRDVLLIHTHAQLMTNGDIHRYNLTFI